MPPRARLWSSTIGRKAVIGLTGLALVGFLVLHLAGNLLVFAGPEVYNLYSHQLITNPLLIPAEIALAALFLLHVYRTVRMWVEGRRARPDRYAMKRRAGYPSRKSVASTTMIVSGLVVLAFVPIHLRTFKYGAYYLAADGASRDLYRLVVEVFQNPVYVLFYVVCMTLVGLHVRHGVWSALQSLGLDHPRLGRRAVVGGAVVAVVIGGGFAFIPVLILLMGSAP